MSLLHRLSSRSLLIVLTGVFLAQSVPVRAQDGVDQKSSSADQIDAATQQRYDEFSRMLSGAKFKGNFTVVNQDMSDLTAEEYHIKSVQKMDKGDMWLFTARIKYKSNDYSVPIPLQVKWAGDDTPVITVTDFSFFGVGPFSSRVVIYNGKYAGTWSHGDVHGHLFGTIEPGAAEGVDVEKSRKELEEKMKRRESDKK